MKPTDIYSMYVYILYTLMCSYSVVRKESFKVDVEEE